MQSESLMLYKLIILYILDRLNFPISNQELFPIIVDKGYCDHITTSHALGDLIDDGYVEVESEHSHRNNLYCITSAGKETLSFFYTRISVAIRDEIDTYLSENEYQLREMVATTADYYEAKKNEFVVELRVVERDSELVHINLLVTSEAEADMICNRWKECSADVYGYLISTLAAAPQPASK